MSCYSLVIGEVTENKSVKVNLTHLGKSVSAQLAGWDHFK